MDSSTVRGSSRRGRLWTRIWQVALILLLAIVACALALRWHWRHGFHRRIEAIRAAGYPVTPTEHDAWYAWPQSGANAANWILGAAAMHQEPPKKEDWERLQRVILSHNADRPDPAQPLDADLRGVLEQYIQANAKALESLHEVTTIAECRYPMNLSAEPGSILMGHIGEVRKSMLLLCHEAVLHAERGDPNGAATAIKASLHVANSLDNEPVVISRMVRMSGLITAAAALERALNQVEFTDRQLEMLYRAFHGLDVKGGLLRALAGQRCMMFPLFQRPRAIDRRAFDRLPPASLLEVYSALGLSAREGAIYLDFTEECMRIARLPVSEYRGAIEAAEARYLRGRKRILLPHVDYISGVVRAETMYQARLEVARVSLAVERYRRAQGKLPETLDLLVPDDWAEVPEDPFDGRPLRYKRMDRGYVVYSVGEDGKDDGGSRQPAKEARMPGVTWDLVFQVRR